MNRRAQLGLLAMITVVAPSCASSTGVYRDPNMDFGSIERVAVLPFENLSRTVVAADRVYDVACNHLLATGAFYVIPRGEVNRGMRRAAMKPPAPPSVEEMIKLGKLINADVVVTGVVREYEELRSGRATANAVSLSLAMYETQTGRAVWTASATKGGVGLKERLLGGGGEPMNEVTEEVVDELLDILFE